MSIKKGKRIDYRVDDESYSKLSELANVRGMSVHEMARMLLIETLNSDSTDNESVRELRNDIISASKELAILQHYIERITGNNIIKESMKGSVDNLWLSLNQHMSYM